MQNWNKARAVLVRKLEKNMDKSVIPTHKLYLEIEHKVIDYLNDIEYQNFTEYTIDLITSYEQEGIPIDENFISDLLEWLDLLVERTDKWLENKDFIESLIEVLDERT